MITVIIIAALVVFLVAVTTIIRHKSIEKRAQDVKTMAMSLKGISETPKKTTRRKKAV